MTATPAELGRDTSLLRFDVAQRLAHWANAALFLALLGTGAVLYGAPGTAWVARRELVKTIHVWSGLALPVPILVALIASSRFRVDLRRVSRWRADDWNWWSKHKRKRAKLGKFNPGQKLNVVFVGASIVVTLGTGSIMRWPGSFSDPTRTSATVVHDWTAWALGIVIAGHILFALRDRAALQSMLTGRISAVWARRHAPRWYAEHPHD